MHPQTLNSDYQLESVYPKPLPSLDKYMHNTQVKMPKDSEPTADICAHTELFDKCLFLPISILSFPLPPPALSA